MINETFDRLTVLAKSDKKNKCGQFYFLCKCICGNEKLVLGVLLKSGGCKSCGCIKKKPDGYATYNELFRSYKDSAKKRNIIWNLSLETYIKIISKNCYYCNEPPQLKNSYLKIDGTHKKEDYPRTKKSIDRAWVKANGVDRIINNEGYNEENCVSCCKVCNQMKMAYSKTEFLNHVEKIVNFQKGKNEN